MGKRMKEILEVLQQTKTPLTLSEIVVRIYDGEKIIEDYRGSRLNKVASAIAKGPMSLESTSFPTVTGRKKRYHPYDYAYVLYAQYSRSLKLLFKHDLVRCVDYWKSNRKHWVVNVNKPFLNV